MVALKALGTIVAGIMWVISAIFSFGITILIGLAVYAIARKLVRNREMPERDAFFASQESTS